MGVSHVNRSCCRALLLPASLVVIGVALRLWLADEPNFSPVAGIALYAGFRLRSIFAAASVPLLIMALSDWFVGGYSLAMMLVVYGMLAAPVGLRGVCRRLWGQGTFRELPLSSAASRLAGLAACGLVMSVAFYVVTNGAVWLLSGSYSLDAAGLGRCYASAWPFFRNTCASDQLFSFGLFGVDAVAVALGAAASSRSAWPTVIPELGE